MKEIQFKQVIVQLHTDEKGNVVFEKGITFKTNKLNNAFVYEALTGVFKDSTLVKIHKNSVPLYFDVGEIVPVSPMILDRVVKNIVKPDITNNYPKYEEGTKLTYTELTRLFKENNLDGVKLKWLGYNIPTILKENKYPVFQATFCPTICHHVIKALEQMNLSYHEDIGLVYFVPITGKSLSVVYSPKEYI